MSKGLLRKASWTFLVMAVLSPIHSWADWVANCDYRNIDGSQPSQTFATQQQCLDAINETSISSTHCNCTDLNSGGSQGLSAEQIQQNQDRADAAKLSQQGQDAFQRGDYDSALNDFQQALEKDPDGSSIRQDIQKAKGKIAERKKFNEDKQDALSHLKGGQKKGNVDADGLKGMDDPTDGGLKDTASDNSGLKQLDDAGKVSSSTQGKRNRPPASDGKVVERQGVVTAYLKDGRKLTGADVDLLPLADGTRVTTGPNGHMKLLLPDETVFTLGPNSDMTLDEFVYDPKTGKRTIEAQIANGTLRWVTGKVQKSVISDTKLKTPVVTIGIRGTDFQVMIRPDGSGWIKLRKGTLELTEKKTGIRSMLKAGKKIDFSAGGHLASSVTLDR